MLIRYFQANKNKQIYIKIINIKLCDSIKVFDKGNIKFSFSYLFSQTFKSLQNQNITKK
jgi:hypothetical protein